MLHPDLRAVMPLRPEPIVQQDGRATQAGERQAAQRFSSKLRQDPPPRTCIVPADALRAHAPHIATLHESGCHSMLGGKAGDQASRCKQGQWAEAAGRLTYSERHARPAGVGQRFGFGNAVPLHASRAAVRVGCMAYGAIGKDQGQPCSWVTALRGHTRQVSQLRRGGRARWKMANAPCNTLKNHGYHCEPT
jgi:hypothetical protein